MLVVTNTEAKFREMILYICLNSEVDPDFGGVKLTQLLFYTDLEALQTIGRTISGQEYQKLQQGPVPCSIRRTLKSMEVDGDLVTRAAAVLSYTQEKPFALREPDLGYFSAQEIALMDACVHKYRGMGARAISDASREFTGWQVVGYGDAIPLGAVFISDRQLTVGERDHARHLVAPAGGLG